MAWNGAKIKARLKELGITQQSIAKKMEISRVALNNWINGQIPKGIHLIKLCKELNVGADFFFEDYNIYEVSVPRHRTIRNINVTDDMHKGAVKLAMQFEKLFRNAPEPGMVPVLRVSNINNIEPSTLAENLRELSEIQENLPMSYKNTFLLLNKLGIVSIFKDFPPLLKTYAFYCRIHNHRIVFVNYLINVLDLIFPLLHESVHAIFDDNKISTNEIYDDEMEKFCDNVANYTQFPDGYVFTVMNELKGKSQAFQIKTLKYFSEKNHHSLYGLVKRLEQFGQSLPSRAIGGADTNLKRIFPTIGEVLFNSKDPFNFIQSLQELSPRIFNIIKEKMDYCTVRKFGEWLGLDNKMDSIEVKRAFEKYLKMM